MFEGFGSDDSFYDFSWDFGDGTAEVGQYVSHTFPAMGDYIVTLSATSDSCGNVTSTQIVRINDNFHLFYSYMF